MRLHIANGRVIDPAHNIDARKDVYIANGNIIAVGTVPDGFIPDHEIDASNCIVCPGLVDLRAHFREPGQEHKATIASESRAAARAGITTVCCPPDTDPVVDTPAVATLIRRRAEETGITRIVPLGALTQDLQGQQISEMSALKDAGCVGVSNAMRPMSSLITMRRAMEYAATHDLTVFIHAEDPFLANNGCVHEGAVGTRLGLPGIPEAAETVAVATSLALIEQTGVRAHFSMISTARAVQMIARAQFDGLPITADASAHHLHLTEIDVLDFDSMCHVRPPLRTQRDCEGLRHGLAKKTLSAICSDHQPHEADAKLAPFSATATGISGLETLLPLSLRLVDDGIMTLPEVIARLTCMPARILGIDAGSLSPGNAADICIFDPQQYWTLTTQNMVSHGHNTPFLDWELKGLVTHTLLGGKLVYDTTDEDSS